MYFGYWDPLIMDYLNPRSLEWPEGFSVSRFDYTGAEKSQDLLEIQGFSLVEVLVVKKIPLQDLLSSLNAVISTNVRSWIHKGSHDF